MSASESRDAGKLLTVNIQVSMLEMEINAAAGKLTCVEATALNIRIKFKKYKYKRNSFKATTHFCSESRFVQISAWYRQQHLETL